MKQLVLAVVCTWLFAIVAKGQTLQWLDSSQKGVSFRGLGCAPDGSVWVSGSKGSVGKSTDGGKTWQWVSPSGYTQRDFRAVEAFSRQTAIIMAVDSPGLLLKTKDGGQSWQKVFESHESGIFLDDLSFSNSQTGICVGDPVKDNRMYLLYTTDSGNSWQPFAGNAPHLSAGEAMFAASNTNAVPWPSKKASVFAVATGGTQSRIWQISLQPPSVQSFKLPITQGGQYTGVNGLASYKNTLMAMGGDFTAPQLQDSIWVIMVDGKPTRPANQPPGYKSSIALNAHAIVACGTTGIALLPRATGKNSWQLLSPTGMHVVMAAPDGRTFWLAGPNGRLAKIEVE